jgi:hypothetical protein
VLKEHISGSIKENQKALHKFSGRNSSLAFATGFFRWFDVPRLQKSDSCFVCGKEFVYPTDLCKATSPTPKCQDSIPEENPTFNKVGKTRKHLSATL